MHLPGPTSHYPHTHHHNQHHKALKKPVVGPLPPSVRSTSVTTVQETPPAIPERLHRTHSAQNRPHSRSSMPVKQQQHLHHLQHQQPSHLASQKPNIDSRGGGHGDYAGRTVTPTNTEQSLMISPSSSYI